ncbi:MAG: hypothetical protein P8L45_09945 [Longimicrobiales bacterium]|nr:hypothetical protein [Longimicrobiales bacterium]
MVDDEAGQPTLFKSILEGAGYRVDVVSDGPAAFVIPRLAKIVFPAFGIGEGGLRLLVVATGLGFPVSRRPPGR